RSSSPTWARAPGGAPATRWSPTSRSADDGQGSARRQTAVVDLRVVASHRDLPLELLDDPRREVDVVELLGARQAAGAEDVDLHQLVADDVEPHEEHAVGDQFGPHHVD